MALQFSAKIGRSLEPFVLVFRAVVRFKVEVHVRTVNLVFATRVEEHAMRHSIVQSCMCMVQTVERDHAVITC